MTSQASELATTAVQQVNEIRQRAVGLAEEYELPKKLVKISEVAQPYQDKVTSTIEPYRQQAVQQVTEKRQQAVEKVAEGKKKVRSILLQLLAKLYASLVSALAWLFTFVAKMIRRAPIEKPKAVVQTTTEKFCDLVQDKVSVKVAEKVEKAVLTAQEKGTELIATVKTAAESGVTYIDAKLLDNKCAPTVKQLLADVQQEQEKQQKEKDEDKKKKAE